MKEFKIGDTVEITESRLSSTNKIGDIGSITETDVNIPDAYRVTVEGKGNYANWQHVDELQLKTKKK